MIYVGNLPFAAHPEDVRAVLQPFFEGEITVEGITDDKGRLRGFAYIQLEKVNEVDQEPEVVL